MSHNVRVRNTRLGGYVHFHSIGPGFSPDNTVRFENVILGGLGRVADQFRIPGSPSIRYAFYLNQNPNLNGPTRWLDLVNVDARVIEADALLHLYGGGARIDHRTLDRSRDVRDIILGGSPGRYSSILELERNPGQVETFEVTTGVETIRP